MERITYQAITEITPTGECIGEPRTEYGQTIEEAISNVQTALDLTSWVGIGFDCEDNANTIILTKGEQGIEVDVNFIDHDGEPMNHTVYEGQDLAAAREVVMDYIRRHLTAQADVRIRGQRDQIQMWQHPSTGEIKIVAEIETHDWRGQELASPKYSGGGIEMTRVHPSVYSGGGGELSMFDRDGWIRLYITTTPQK